MQIEAQVLNDLEKILVQYTRVIAAYIYGSRVNGTANSFSDLDMALVVNDVLGIDYGEIYLKLLKLFPDVEVDLRIVSLKNDPLYIFQILKNGKCIYSKDEKERIAFETKAMREFYDGIKIRAIFDYYLKKSLKTGNYGRG